MRVVNIVEGVEDEELRLVRLAGRTVVTIKFVIVMVARRGGVLVEDGIAVGMAMRMLERAMAAKDGGPALSVEVDIGRLEAYAWRRGVRFPRKEGRGGDGPICECL